MAGSIIPASGIRRELLKSQNILVCMIMHVKMSMLRIVLISINISIYTTRILQERTLPPPPIQLPKFTESAQFGKEIKKKHFFLDVSEHI